MKIHCLALGFAIASAGVAAHAKDSIKPKGPEEDGTKSALTRIAGEGMMGSRAFEYLTELSDDIGPRVTGSPQDKKAVDWGLSKMKSIGLENVHTEKWTMWKGWTRGAASAELIAPVERQLDIDAMGWTGSTPPGGAEADVVTANLFDLDDEADSRPKACT